MKRVLVVINKLLFGVGLESLLSQEQDLSVKSIPFKNKKTLVKEIRQYEPNVVLVDESIRTTNMPTIFDILTGFPDIRLLVINTRENSIQVYDKQEIQVTRSLDFITAIKN
ncbi:MAG: hypothetical protein MUO62_01925 [Anaerolineales bacterium]|nr:hypothetical protein [Anaerolineales bacterium]